MIKIKELHECCGCEACVQRCPVGCISLFEDREGFLYPRVDAQRCIECGACEGVCPELNLSPTREPIAVLGAKCDDANLRAQSSSGGIFSLLAADVIASRGVVFGAKFDPEWGVVHSAARSEKELEQMRGSKYLQSRIGDSFVQVERLLKDGRQVLFSGTPCQVAALRLFLGRPYDNLLLVDVACHGVPSPKVWRKYLESVANPTTIERINFRDKSSGWRDYKLVIESPGGRSVCQSHINNIYMQGFIKALSLRPSCYGCPAKCGRSGSDVTLADFWNVRSVVPSFSDNRGVSLLLVGSAKGAKRLSRLNVTSVESSYARAVEQSSSLCHSPRLPEQRAELFESIDGDVIGRLGELLRAPLYRRIIWIVKRLYVKAINR